MFTFQGHSDLGKRCEPHGARSVTQVNDTIQCVHELPFCPGGSWHCKEPHQKGLLDLLQKKTGQKGECKGINGIVSFAEVNFKNLAVCCVF